MSTKFFPRLFEIVSALFFELRSGIDWILFTAVVPIVFAGLATMNSFRGDSQLFEKQFLWFCISLVVFFVFKDYQKQRILNFIHPLADIQGTGYNAYQSTIAVGSGQFFGKGVGYGTQSRLKFFPEYETDFIFAAFAEEWGFVGVLLLFALYGVVFWRILDNALHGSTNFEILFGVGVACFFLSHFLIHIRINIGLLAVTGTTVPFMSYGGSHLLAEWSSLGILMGMRKYRKTFHKDAIRNEFVGVE